MKFVVKSRKREEIIDITDKVNELIEENKDAKHRTAVLIYCPHTTCSIIINEISDENVCEDLLEFLRKEIPQGKWKHDLGEGNADSHIKASILGTSKIIPVENGKLMLGTWQKIGLAEFDGPRERRIVVKIF